MVVPLCSWLLKFPVAKSHVRVGRGNQAPKETLTQSDSNSLQSSLTAIR